MARICRARHGLPSSDTLPYRDSHRQNSDCLDSTALLFPAPRLLTWRGKCNPPQRVCVAGSILTVNAAIENAVANRPPAASIPPSGAPVMAGQSGNFLAEYAAQLASTTNEVMAALATVCSPQVAGKAGRSGAAHGKEPAGQCFASPSIPEDFPFLPVSAAITAEPIPVPAAEPLLNSSASLGVSSDSLEVLQGSSSPSALGAQGSRGLGGPSADATADSFLKVSSQVAADSVSSAIRSASAPSPSATVFDLPDLAAPPANDAADSLSNTLAAAAAPIAGQADVIQPVASSLARPILAQAPVDHQVADTKDLAPEVAAQDALNPPAGTVSSSSSVSSDATSPVPGAGKATAGSPPQLDRGSSSSDYADAVRAALSAGQATAGSTAHPDSGFPSSDFTEAVRAALSMSAAPADGAPNQTAPVGAHAFLLPIKAQTDLKSASPARISAAAAAAGIVPSDPVGDFLGAVQTSVEKTLGLFSAELRQSPASGTGTGPAPHSVSFPSAASSRSGAATENPPKNMAAGNTASVKGDSSPPTNSAAPGTTSDKPSSPSTSRTSDADQPTHKNASAAAVEAADISSALPQASADSGVTPQAVAQSVPSQPTPACPADKPDGNGSGLATSQAPNLPPAAESAASPAASPVQMAQMVTKAAQSEMRIELNTAAFGGVEVRTIVHANDVGVVIGSERGDLRSLLATELPGIAHNLQQQDLRLNQVNFHQSFAFSNNQSAGNSGGNPQARSFRNAQVAPAEMRADSAEPEAPGVPGSPGRLSILA